MVITLGEASRRTGKSKAAITKAIGTGRLSAAKSETGDWQIDPAELFRVYPPASEPENKHTPEVHPAAAVELGVLRERCGHLENQIADLRRGHAFSDNLPSLVASAAQLRESNSMLFVLPDFRPCVFDEQIKNPPVMKSCRRAAPITARSEVRYRRDLALRHGIRKGRQSIHAAVIRRAKVGRRFLNSMLLRGAADRPQLRSFWIPVIAAPRS
jgi:hypothetical protein